MRTLGRYPDTEMIYTDEDKIGPGDRFMQPNLKPDYDPDFLHSVNYICHLLLVSRALYERTGDLDPAFDGAQDYDFILRCTEHTSAIRHVPEILYHWRFFEGSTSANPEAKSYAFEAGRRAVQAWYDRQNLPAAAENGEYPGLYRTRWHWKEEPLVSVLIPNKDHLDDLRTAVRSLLGTTSYRNLEILIIENNSEQEMPARDVTNAAFMPSSSTGMPFIRVFASVISSPVRPRVRPMNVPRMPREVSREGISSLRDALPGMVATVRVLI